MTKDNLITAKEGISMEQAESILQEHKIEKLPIIDKNGKLIGLITYKDILKRKSHPLASKGSPWPSSRRCCRRCDT